MQFAKWLPPQNLAVLCVKWRWYFLFTFGELIKNLYQNSSHIMFGICCFVERNWPLLSPSAEHRTVNRRPCKGASQSAAVSLVFHCQLLWYAADQCKPRFNWTKCQVLGVGKTIKDRFLQPSAISNSCFTAGRQQKTYCTAVLFSRLQLSDSPHCTADLTSSAGFFEHKHSNWFSSTNSSRSCDHTDVVNILALWSSRSCNHTGAMTILVPWWYRSRDHILVLWPYRKLIPVPWSYWSLSHIRPLSQCFCNHTGPVIVLVPCWYRSFYHTGPAIIPDL